MLNEDFRIYAVDQVTLPNVVRNGQLVSEITAKSSNRILIMIMYVCSLFTAQSY